jgi:hypothetical protein
MKGNVTWIDVKKPEDDTLKEKNRFEDEIMEKKKEFIEKLRNR